ncbi:MAG: hypothetical protein WDO24_05415 [Pseudomonadota bacterium]
MAELGATAGHGIGASGDRCRAVCAMMTAPARRPPRRGGRRDAAGLRRHRVLLHHRSRGRRRGDGAHLRGVEALLRRAAGTQGAHRDPRESRL